MNVPAPTLAICGLDCTDCTIFQAAEQPEIAQRIANWFVEEGGIEVRPEQIRCAGCHGDPPVQWSESCAIRTCAQSRGLATCAACPELVCARLAAWAQDDERHTAAVARLEQMQGQPGNDPALVSWLLAARTPSIRYLTLRRLLDRPRTDPEVQVAWEEIKTVGPIPTILAGQTRAGNWTGERSYYTPKYISTHWGMLLLTELAADGRDPHLQRGAAWPCSWKAGDWSPAAIRPGASTPIGGASTFPSFTRPTSSLSCASWANWTPSTIPRRGRPWNGWPAAARPTAAGAAPTPSGGAPGSSASGRKRGGGCRSTRRSCCSRRE